MSVLEDTRRYRHSDNQKIMSYPDAVHYLLCRYTMTEPIKETDMADCCIRQSCFSVQGYVNEVLEGAVFNDKELAGFLLEA